MMPRDKERTPCHSLKQILLVSMMVTVPDLSFYKKIRIQSLHARLA
jgi:hypothetical protein